MSKKILIVGIIIAVITIIAVSVTLVRINLEKNNNQTYIGNLQENNGDNETNNSLEETNNVNNNISPENLIQEYWTDMKNQDFTSAVELFDKEEFDNITGEAEENIMGDRLEEFLKGVYNNSKIFSTESSVGNIREINGIEDFKNNFNLEITEDEYNKLFGNNRLYSGAINTNGNSANDIFIITNDNKIAGTILLITYYNILSNANNALENNNLQDVERESFNNKFKPYEGEMTGEKVNELINNVSYNNIAYEDFPERIVTIENNGEQYSNENEFNILSSRIMSNSMYNVTLEYENDWVKKIVINN